MSFPSECVLERRVRSDGDLDFDKTDLPLFILDCKDRKAQGYSCEKQLKIHNRRVKKMSIGVRLAVAPPAVSHLTIRGGLPLAAQIVAVDKNVIVIRLVFMGDGGQMSFLIYDAVALSLRLVPPPQMPSWVYTLSANISIARPCQGDDDVYALVLTGRLAGVDVGDSLYLWRPSSPSPPWSEKKQIIDCSVNQRHMEFSFRGHAYWVDLLRGVSYCSCDALFDDDDTTGVAKFGGFISLPSGACSSFPRDSERVSQPDAYRTMGVVRGSIRFVSINGFQSYVELKDRTITVWKLRGHDKGWKKKHELSMKTLWGCQGFGDVPKNLTPMYPHLSTKDPDLVYLLLGQYREDQFNWKFIATIPSYLLAVDMRNKIVTSVPLEDLFPDTLLSCAFSKSLRKALLPAGGNDPVKKKQLKRRRC